MRSRWERVRAEKINNELNESKLPPPDLNAAKMRASIGLGRPGRRRRAWIGSVIVLGALALAGTVFASPGVPGAVPTMARQLIADLHLTVVSRRGDGTLLAKNPQGFQYKIQPLGCPGGKGRCGVGILTSGRRVTLAQAYHYAAQAEFRLILPAGLPPGAQLVTIGEPAPVLGQPDQVVFVYRTAGGGTFGITEYGPPGVNWSGDVTYWVQEGTQVVLGGGTHVLTPNQIKGIRSAMMATSQR